MAQAGPKESQHLQQIVGRLFTDQTFAKAMEKNPEQALSQAGFELSPHQLSALRSRPTHAALTGPDPAAVAAFVSPVVSVVTSGTQPVVNVVVSSAVVASAEDDKSK